MKYKILVAIFALELFAVGVAATFIDDKKAVAMESDLAIEEAADTEKGVAKSAKDETPAPRVTPKAIAKEKALGTATPETTDEKDTDDKKIEKESSKNKLIEKDELSEESTPTPTPTATPQTEEKPTAKPENKPAKKEKVWVEPVYETVNHPEEVSTKRTLDKVVCKCGQEFVANGSNDAVADYQAHRPVPCDGNHNYYDAVYKEVEVVKPAWSEEVLISEGYWKEL